MALGSDTRMGPAPRLYTSMSPKPGSAPTRSPAQRYNGAPQINDSAVSSAANNRLAEAGGAAQGAIREMDRAGTSRGKGQQYAASIAEAAADADARSDVAKMEQGVAMQNAAARQSYDNMKKNERLSTEGLLEQLRGNDISERLARQGWGLDAYEALRRGQFGLDQMRLDMSPLWQRLFS